LEKTWLEQPRLCSVWVHRTVRWCTGQCPVCQAGVWSTGCSRVSTAAYGYKSLDCPVVHRTVSGESATAKSPLSGTKSTAYGYNSPDCPVRHRTVRCANGRPRNPRVTRGRANGRMGAPDCPVCTGVRCTNGSKSSMVGCAKIGKKSAPDCPVCQSTEGKNCLAGLLSTAPSCLGAIKGTPRRMEEHTKHTLSILDHSHSVFAHSFDILSDFSSVLVRTL
jgi:hypothetical protein